MPQPTKEAPEGFADINTARRFVLAKDAGPEEPKSEKKGRPELSDEELKELKRSLPALEKARVLEALKVTPHSRLARMAFCVDLPVAETTSLFIRAYKRKKWSEVTVSTPPHDGNRRSFTGNSKRFRMNGNTSQGEFETCKKSQGQSRVALNFQERQPASEQIKQIKNPLLAPAGKPKMVPAAPKKEPAKAEAPSKPSKDAPAKKAE
jgi:hypothetical protein